MESKAIYTAHNACHNTSCGTILMVTNVEQLIPNAEGKDLICVGLEYICQCTLYDVFLTPLPLVYVSMSAGAYKHIFPCGGCTHQSN